MDVCTASEMAPRGSTTTTRARRPKSRKKKFSQLNIDEKVKLAVEKNAAEAEKKAAEAAEANKNELVQQAVNAAVAACRNDFATNLIPAIID